MCAHQVQLLQVVTELQRSLTAIQLYANEPQQQLMNVPGLEIHCYTRATFSHRPSDPALCNQHAETGFRDKESEIK